MIRIVGYALNLQMGHGMRARTHQGVKNLTSWGLAVSSLEPALIVRLPSISF